MEIYPGVATPPEGKAWSGSKTRLEKPFSTPMASPFSTVESTFGFFTRKRWGDTVFFGVTQTIALGAFFILMLIGGFLTYQAWPSVETFGTAFLYSSDWNVVKEKFGALPVIYGTLASSFVAMVISAPLSVGVALYLNEMASPRLRRVLGFMIDMLAAIPSVVFGLWGIFVLAPFLRTSVQPFLQKWLGFLPIFSGPTYGIGLMAGGVLLAIMILPTISSISREVFQAVPQNLREGALALGATRWEMIRLAVVTSTRPGVLAAMVLGLGRALGETMAVTMVIGNRADIAWSLFAPAQTMASVIANEYAEASQTLHASALAEIGLVLFLITFIINSLARIVIWRVRQKT